MRVPCSNERLAHHVSLLDIPQFQTKLSPGDRDELIPLWILAAGHLGNGGDVGDLPVLLHREYQLHHTYIMAVQGQGSQLLLALLLPEDLHNHTNDRK